MKKIAIIIGFFLLGSTFCVNAQEMTQKEKNNYTLGAFLGEKMKEEVQKSGIDMSIVEPIIEKLKEKIDFSLIKEGFRDNLKEELKLSKEEMMTIIAELEKEKDELERFFKGGTSNESKGENNEYLYKKLTEEANKLYQSKEFLQSAQKYTEAFIAVGDRGLVSDRYNAACSWALSGESDAAFLQLFRIAKNGNFTHLKHIIEDADLNSLHQDKRWNQVVKIVKSNRKKEFTKAINTIKTNEKNGLNPENCWNTMCE